jgi:hypothetical protein
MKFAPFIRYTFVFCLFFNACRQESSSSENANLASSQEQLIIKEAWNSSSEWVKQITQSDSLVIRNKYWGMDFNQVKDPLDLAESQPALGKSFSLYFDDSDLNFVDITYVPNASGKLAEIDLDVYVEEVDQVKTFQKSIKEFFDVKFGTSISNGKKIIWSQNKNTQVELEDVSTAKDPGIKIVLKAKP